ncbi:MAG: HAMP domain-containing histidine kinase [Clostridiales bacterium]|nr:HAMP domain-containing histidine kinase [Clostridiales bacterium]
MKKYLSKYILLFLICVLLGLGVFLFFSKTEDRNKGQRKTLMNRVTTELSKKGSENIESDLNAMISSNSWEEEYGKSNVPTDIRYMSLSGSEDGMYEITGGTSVWKITEDGTVKGFLVFSFNDDHMLRTIIICEASIAVVFVIAVLFFIYIDRKVIMPFNTLSEYPERIAKNENAAALPESKNRYFGRYIWGMNMLRDRLSGDNRKLRQMEKEQLTLVSTIAHGIKTPVANIKLYSEAIKSGLYRDDGVPDKKDSEVADKITKNADDITDLLQELLESASKGVVVFEPKKESFYLTEIEEFIKREYDNRLSVLRIPYEIDMRSKVMINSDKTGIIRILTQLMENAIKYGDGRGIKVIVDKNEDGYTFAVRDKGSRIPEGEMPYIFNSFWRGSNAADVEGNGLGLYEASFIARKLGGDIVARYLDETEETELEVFLPL